MKKLITTELLGKTVLIRESISSACPIVEVTIKRFSENGQYFKYEISDENPTRVIWDDVINYTFIDYISPKIQSNTSMEQQQPSLKAKLRALMGEILEENANPPTDQLSPSEAIAAKMAKFLNQNYRQFAGKWYMFNGDVTVRVLSDEEVQQHIRMNRAPFVEDGVEDCEDVRWWRGPVKSDNNE